MPEAPIRKRVPLARTAGTDAIVRRIKETDDKITALPVAAFNSSI